MNDIRSTVDSASRALGSDEKVRLADHKAITKLVDSVVDICRRNNLAGQVLCASFQVAGTGNATYFVEMSVHASADGVLPTMSMMHDLLKHILLGADRRVAMLDSVTYDDKTNSFHCKFNFASAVNTSNKKKAAPIVMSAKKSRTRGPHTTIAKRSVPSRAKTSVNYVDDELNNSIYGTDDDDGELSERVVSQFTSPTTGNSALPKTMTTTPTANGDGVKKKWWNPLTWLASAEHELTRKERSVVSAFEYKPALFSEAT